jgi:hypothetical protein
VGRRARTLDRRALNRALLERQLLLRRRRLPPLAVVERLVGLHAQVPRDAYVALWSRLDRFRPETLSDAIEDRRAVRLTLFRGTLHLVTAEDALALRPVVQPIVERTFRSSSPLRTAWGSVDEDELLTFLRDRMEERPSSRTELVAAIRERWPDRDADALAYAMYLLDSCQATPRGLWGRSGRAAFTTLRRWLGRAPSAAGDPEALVLRYLTAFGPASPADVQAWSGLGGMRELLERLRPRLRTFRGDDGRELFDVPRGSLPDPDTPAPVRFMPEYDNASIGFKDRSRILPHGVSLWANAGWGTVLVDGSIAARWRLTPERGAIVLRVEPFRRLSRSERADVTEEGTELAGFLAPGADADVRIDAPR